ncbi:uncharacterized protein LOC144712006 [Wolffia australiana]
MASRGRRRRACPLRRVDDLAARRVCFSKRRRGLLSKAEAFAAAFAGWRVAVVAISECDRTFSAAFGGSEDPHAIVDRVAGSLRGDDDLSESAKSGVIDELLLAEIDCFPSSRL